MTKQELIERVARTQGLPADLTKKTVARLVDAVFDELGAYFVKSRLSKRTPARFSYPGFGTFTKKRRVGRPGRNPLTGETLTIPPTTTVVFQPGQELKAFLNRDHLKREEG